jgi:hypothetical protein
MIRPNQPPQPIEPGQRYQPRRRKLTRLAGVLAAAVVISWGGPAANAFWQTLGSNAGTARADSIPAVAAPGASVSGGSASITWKQGTTAGGRPVAGYTVARYSAATGTKVAIGPGCAGKITALGCSEASLPPGTWYYTVTPVLGAWAGVESARSGEVTAADTTPPAAPTIMAPAVINSAPATTNSANVGSVPVAFSAEQGSSVRITATETAPAGGNALSVFQVLTASGSSQTINFNLSALRDGTITYTAVATDAAGNSSLAGTATSSKDTTPTATVTLGNQNGTVEKGDTIAIKYSSDIDSKSICSAWTNDRAAPDITGNNVVTVTITSTNTLTVSTEANALCAPKIGVVSLGSNYVTNGTLTFKGSGNGGNASKIAWDNGTQTLTITLGARDGTAKTDVAESFPTVSPPAGVVDTSGNQAVGVTPAAPSRF